jgi:hypothetical protein
MPNTRADEHAADTAWRRWMAACKTLSAAEHEGLPTALLQQLADDVIETRFSLDLIPVAAH